MPSESLNELICLVIVIVLIFQAFQNEGFLSVLLGMKQEANMNIESPS